MSTMASHRAEPTPAERDANRIRFETELEVRIAFIGHILLRRGHEVAQTICMNALTRSLRPTRSLCNASRTRSTSSVGPACPSLATRSLFPGSPDRTDAPIPLASQLWRNKASLSSPPFSSASKPPSAQQP